MAHVNPLDTYNLIDSLTIWVREKKEVQLMQVLNAKLTMLFNFL